MGHAFVPFVGCNAPLAHDMLTGMLAEWIVTKKIERVREEGEQIEELPPAWGSLRMGLDLSQQRISPCLFLPWKRKTFTKDLDLVSSRTRRQGLLVLIVQQHGMCQLVRVLCYKHKQSCLSFQNKHRRYISLYDFLKSVALGKKCMYYASFLRQHAVLMQFRMCFY